MRECNFIYACKKSMASSALTVKTLATEPHYVQIPDTEGQLIKNIYV
jgi:hypothetical protein